MEGQHLVEARDAAHQRVDLESPAPERRHHLGLRAARQRAHLAPGVGEEAQRTRRRDRGIELAQRTRGGVARIGEDLVAGRRLAGVDRGEIGMPRDRSRRGSPPPPGSPLPRSFFGMSPTVQRIRGDVLADRAVAAGRGGDELALLIAQAQRQAVDLRLGREDERRLRAEREEAPDAFDELAHVLLAEAVGERQHRHAMAHLGEFLRGLRADLLGQASPTSEARESAPRAPRSAGAGRRIPRPTPSARPPRNSAGHAPRSRGRARRARRGRRRESGRPGQAFGRFSSASVWLRRRRTIAKARGEWRGRIRPFRGSA